MKTSKIEWTEATWNPSIGCNKITAGCKFCYAEVMAKRLKAMGNKDYNQGFKFKILPNRLNMPFTITKPTKFFVNSMSDLFHEKMPFTFLDQVFETIRLTPHHHYQILTKRENILFQYFNKNTVPTNVWLGVTVEMQKTKNRIDVLRKIPANIRFLSLEPLLEDLGELNLKDIHWVIVGGESGPNARQMKPAWVENIKKQCLEQNVKFFFKQWGTWGSDGKRRSKKANGRVFLGEVWNEEPTIMYNTALSSNTPQVQ